MCNEGGDQAQGWLSQLLQWEDYIGGDWFILGCVCCLVISTLFCSFMRAWDCERQERDELEKEMEMWQDTEVWDD